ncbi:TMV resistance protein N-like [Castanea sativa]|uniref:TMV resistance protein N-like n=1 Tax=Castanea sativa TaxID=21020 RepID=UPI003F64A1EF
MASMSTGRAISPSSSSSFTPRWKYDVFLSFRGKDTRNNFTDHLYLALKQKGIFTFRDDEKLERGKSISPELSKAIEESRLAIVIFSRNYAFSTWCLDELAKIIGCVKETGMTVLPIFYNVDPSDIRKQIGTFAEAFAKHEERFEKNIKKVQKWRDALREAGNLSGWYLQDRSEAECIQDIVQVILNKLRNTFSAHTMGLIGIESRVEKLKSYLAIESNDVRIIGIWGTGGMGKTTLARVVYSMVSNHFEACCFIANVREESKKCGLCKLQKILLKKLLMLENLNLQDVDDGVQMIKNRLHNKKILLVLDDVNELDQLKKLAGEHCWFGSGSRIMITTRDKHLLVNPEVNEIYEAEVLNHDEALKLFSLKAFKKDHPAEDYEKLSQAFVDYSKGLPLALEVLGSFLCKKNIDEWESELNRLTEFPERRILDVLQISFDGLQPIEKEIFLNIACFFNHMYQDVVIKILDDLGLYPKIGLRVLIDKSLVKLHENQLWMHDLLQQLGRDIVHQECPKDPGKRSRLWLFEDIDNVLTKNTGTEAIQSMVLKLHEPKKVYWNPEAFSKMGDLKLLEICGVQLMHDLKHLPNSLRVLDWRGYPSKSLTSSSQSKSFENLKFIGLSRSLKLIETPDINEIPNLESLVLRYCRNLRRIHQSIGIHKKLTILNLDRCENLRCLPSKFEMECLTKLRLNGCSKITKIPKFGRNMKRVDCLCLSGTAITTLPTSIEHLTNLCELDLRNCKNLVHLPDTIFKLKSIMMVDLYGCSKLDRLPENLGNAKSLSILFLGETAIRKVPSSIGLLKYLCWLDFRGCKGLSSNKSRYELLPFYSMPTIPHPIDLLFSSLSLSPASSLRYLDLEDCNLKAISNDIGSLFSLELLDLSGNDFVCLPESIIRLSKLTLMNLNNCTSLRSLPKLPLNILRVEAGGCISLEMLPDPLKPSDSLEPSLCLQNCFQLADNQSCVDWFISGIKKSLKLSPSLPLPVLKPYHYYPYVIVIPGSEIPEWFSHQSMGNEVKIKQPSHLCKNVGIAICVVFCTIDDPHQVIPDLSYYLIANGKTIPIDNYLSIVKLSSDHVSLAYVVPQFFDEESNKLLWEGDVNGFSQIRIQIETMIPSTMIKKWGIRMIHKKDIEDLDRTMVQYSNSSISPYDGMDVLHHNFDNSSVAVECHKVKRSRDDYNGAKPSGERSSKRIKRHTETNGNSDSEESSEYKDCDEELSDYEESNERNPDG